MAIGCATAVNVMPEFKLNQIGIIHSCFKEKFGIPRQPGLVREARAELELLPPYNRPEAVRGLEAFSHLWVIFVFHECMRDAWKPTVRPPRLGGNQRLGVFATRSTFRPNPVGMSVVELDRIDVENGVRLYLKGVDLLDGTPVLDIKPYLPYADAITDAHGGFADEAPSARLKVVFSDNALAACEARSSRHPGLQTLITQVLARDPRPAYAGEDAGERVYGMRLLDFDLKWRIAGDEVIVLDLTGRC